MQLKHFFPAFSFTILCNLFAFSQSYTFTPCGATGRFGPTATMVTSSYSNTNLAGQVTTTNGIQSWTVPANGIYRIEANGAFGAGGYTANAGARMQGDFTLTAGQVLKICVGQHGMGGTQAGGGGGSFVTDINNNPMIIAGGGGGVPVPYYYYTGTSNMPGSSGTSGMPGANGNASVVASIGGTLGTGGGICTSYTAGEGSGGGGFTSNGTDGNPSTGGLSFLNGATGGAGGDSPSSGAGDGGFGGGGGAECLLHLGAGGGGGYSGGGGGAYYGCGGGGGSYNAGANQVNTSGANAGDGYVLVTAISGVRITQTATISCYGDLTGMLTASVFGVPGPSSYTWSPVISNATVVSGLGAGTYTCRATDAAGTVYTSVFTVTQNPQLTISATVTNVACYGGNTGNILISASGGQPFYSYSCTPFVVPPYPSGQVAFLSAGIHTVSVHDYWGCYATTTVNITQPPPLTITAIASTSALCQGQNLTLTGGGALNYTWSPGSIGNGVAFYPSATTNYSVIGVDASGCTANANISVTVNPSPTVSVSGSNTLCLGNSVNLLASGASTYSWNTGSSSANISISPATTAIYSVIGTGTNGCQSTASQTVTVFTPPALVAHASSLSICAGATLNLYGSGASTYSWSSGVTDNVPFVPSATSFYTLTGTNACGTSNAVIQVTVNPLPVVTANASNTIVCSGSTVSLYGSGASTYTWASGINDNSPFVLLSAGNYTVTGTDANGCRNSASIAVSVNALPTVSANVSSPTVCLGSSLTFSGSGASTYSWTGGVTNNSPFAPASSSAYTVTGTDLNGCKNVASVSVSVINAPTITAQASSLVVCAGNTVSLYGSGAPTFTWSGTISNNTPFVPSSTASYTVYGANTCFTSSDVITVTVNSLPTLSLTAGANSICFGGFVSLFPSGANQYTLTGGAVPAVPFSPTASTVYSVSGTNTLTGCTSTNTASYSITVNVLPTPTVFASNFSICAGSPEILTASGADTYSWSSGISNGVAFYPVSSNIYTVNGTNTLTGCSNSLTVSIPVNPVPVLTISASAKVVCKGESITLDATGADTYSWSNGVQNNTLFIPNASAVYTVTGAFNTTGCFTTAITSITVNPLPILTINLSAPQVCSGQTAVINALGANTYTISNGVNNSIPFVPTASAAYSISGSSSSTGCSSTVSIVSITVNALPTLSLSGENPQFCSGESLTLSVSGANAYTWSSGETADSVVISPSVITTYTVYGTDGNGCENSMQYTQQVSDCTGLSEIQSQNNQVKIYPNPNNGSFFISGAGEMGLFIFNELGQQVKSFLIRENEPVQISDLPNGIYLLTGQKDKELIKEKIVVAK